MDISKVPKHSSGAPMPDIRHTILPTMESLVGNTPLVRINRVGSELPCEFVAKLEFMNAGSSVKSRIALHMVVDAEARGVIKPGSTLVEATSGNTGIGIAFVAAIRGYHTVVTMPEKMSGEKAAILTALGTTIVRTPTEFDTPDEPRSHISVSRSLCKSLRGAHILDQYSNPCNPGAHYHGTAQEILDQTGGKVDMVVVAAGTGGTLTGISWRLKEALGDACIVVGVDPVGSTLSDKDKTPKSYHVEGIGYSFTPDTLDTRWVDEWVHTEDASSFEIARRLIREEGMLVGGSSGSVMWAAIEAARRHNLTAEHRVVVVFPDSVQNYTSKFVSDAWMVQHGFMTSSEASKPIVTGGATAVPRALLPEVLQALYVEPADASTPAADGEAVAPPAPAA